VLALRRLATSGRAVLVLDQFDALSIVSGRNQELWALVRELLAQAEWFPSLAVVVACRSFDVEHDTRLNELTRRENSRSIKVGLLPPLAVDPILARHEVARSVLSVAQFEMLRLPRNLYLFANIDPERRGGFISVKDLMDRYWESKEAHIRRLTDGKGDWDSTVTALCTELSRREALSAPIGCRSPSQSGANPARRMRRSRYRSVLP
jgi:hypothetical protein